MLNQNTRSEILYFYELYFTRWEISTDDHFYKRQRSAGMPRTIWLNRYYGDMYVFINEWALSLSLSRKTGRFYFGDICRNYYFSFLIAPITFDLWINS